MSSSDIGDFPAFELAGVPKLRISSSSMTERNIEADAAFYRTCASILGVPYQYIEPRRKVTRWNNRHPGNGRYPGFGVIRLYGDQVHLCLTHPELVQASFPNRMDALAFLESVVRRGDDKDASYADPGLSAPPGG